MIQLVSECCKSRYTEEPSPSDHVDHMNVCATCGMPCKVIKFGEPEGKPRSAVQAYNDQFNEDGTLKEENFTIPDAPQNAPTRPSEAPRSAVEVKDGAIYQNGKLIGYTISDKDWYKQEFGEEWKGSDKALKALRQR